MDFFWTVRCNHSQRTTWPVRLRIFDCWSLKILAPLSSKPALFQSSWTAVDWAGYLFYKSGLLANKCECWMFIAQGEDYAKIANAVLTSFFFFYGFKVETNFVFSLQGNRMAEIPKEKVLQIVQAIHLNVVVQAPCHRSIFSIQSFLLKTWTFVPKSSFRFLSASLSLPGSLSSSALSASQLFSFYSPRSTQNIQHIL